MVHLPGTGRNPLRNQSILRQQENVVQKRAYIAHKYKKSLVKKKSKAPYETLNSRPFWGGRDGQKFDIS